MFVSPTKAIKMYNVSKPTLYSDMKSGKLSYQINDRKKREINVAELDRLYKKRENGTTNYSSETVKTKPNLTETNVSTIALEKELEKVKQSLAESQKRETELLKEQVGQLQNQVEKLNINLNKALDITALLEDKREGQGALETQWGAKMEVMEHQLSKLESQNIKLQKIEQERRNKIERLEKEIEERNQNWFKRLFS